MREDSLHLSVGYRENPMRFFHKMASGVPALIESVVVSPNPFLIVKAAVCHGDDEGPFRGKNPLGQGRHPRRASDGDVHNGSLQVLDGFTFRLPQIFGHAAARCVVIRSVLHYLADGPFGSVVVIEHCRIGGAALVADAEAHIGLFLMNDLLAGGSRLHQGPAQRAEQCSCDAESCRPYRSNALIHEGNHAAAGVANADA